MKKIRRGEETSFDIQKLKDQAVREQVQAELNEQHKLSGDPLRAVTELKQLFMTPWIASKPSY